VQVERIWQKRQADRKIFSYSKRFYFWWIGKFVRSFRVWNQKQG